jgi:hypothetical protein
MYCSSCGIAVAQGLSYCNHCGAKLSVARSERLSNSSEVKPDNLVASMVAMFMFGMVAITVLMGVMKSVLGLPVERVLAISLLPFLLMLVLEGVFMRLLLRGRRGTRAGDPAAMKGQATKELEVAHARALPEPLPSVTEHTTRAFDPIYTDRTK